MICLTEPKTKAQQVAEHILRSDGKLVLIFTSQQLDAIREDEKPLDKLFEVLDQFLARFGK
jgi:NADH/NAD ratio-sensing transcriptional regulator Rex